MAHVELQKISKIYPGNIKAVDAVDLSIADQEFVVLVGPSGCGKSTTLRMMAGLEEITGGPIYILNPTVNENPPKNWVFPIDFQHSKLYTHMDVSKKMEFPP